MAISLPIEDALQTIARSRASGVLRVHSKESELSAVFVMGSLSHYQSEEREEVRGICSLLNGAGCLADSVLTVVQEANVAVQQLGSLLVSRKYLTTEEFARARIAYQKNLLLNLIVDGESVESEFSADRTVKSSEQSLNIHATELLLDIVALRKSRRELQALLQNEEPLTFSVVADVPLSGLTLEEIIVVNLLQANGALSVEDLAVRSLMSSADLHVAVESLSSKKLIRQSGAEVRTELNDDEAEEILSDLFDDDLEAETGEGDTTGSADDEEGGMFSGQGYWDEEDADEPAAWQSIPQERPVPEQAPPAEFEPESNRWADTEAEEAQFRGIGAIIRRLSYRFTETSAVHHIVLVITILYLVVLAWLMPTLLRTWFEALANYTNLGIGV